MVYSISSSMTQPAFGYMVDKTRSYWWILISLPGSALFIALSALAPDKIYVFVCVGLAGLASALFHPIASGLIGRVIPAEKRGLAMSLFIGGGNFGFAISPAIVIYILTVSSPIQLVWLIIPGFVVSLIYYILNVHKIDSSTDHSNSEAAHTNRETVIPVIQDWKPILNLNLIMGLRSWMQFAILTLLPIWMIQRGVSPIISGSLLTLFLACGATGSLLGGWFGDRLGHKPLVIGVLITCLPMLYVFISGTEINALTWISLAYCGFALQGTMPSSVVWAQEIMPGKAAMASGMMLGLSSGLGGLGTALTAALADIIGLQSALLWSLIPYGLAIPIAFLIPAYKKI